MRALRIGVLVLLGLSGLGCSARAERLVFIADYNIPAGVPFDEVANPSTHRSALDPARLPGKESGAFGGISAIGFDPASDTLYALSDSSNPVLFVLRLTLDGGALSLEPLGEIRLTRGDGTPFPPRTLDPEGLALSPRGGFFVTSEGYADRGIAPGLFEFGVDGRLVRELPLPPRYRSVRHNRGFESLTLSPGGDRLLLATEGPLPGGGEPCGTRRGCTARIVEYPLDALAPGAGFREQAYPIEPLALPAGFGEARGGSGLVELLAVGGDELLALERGFATAVDGGRSHVAVRVYRLRFGKPGKRLLLDLDGVTDRLSPDFRTLDNFEGMCFGPRVGGRRTILLVSDDNYNPDQRTAFLLFAYEGAS